ncbi:hypothetical protein [Thalassobius sp. Cn5-15]|uniref:hypothetical protein n=1 Tax=Thalassobius sp. Cn5-15 TaxID=2917763 RepID=UPI001EF20A39|nr:hypothetical protein [Thalassobius sp. Cn5-15]MCG7493611.1 hypothetical protein [Thalassobius sp. Cn5-15]
MKQIYTAAFLAALMTPITLPATAGPIERACLTSPRDGATRQLCGCIGRVAKQTLSSTDQRKAAKFFKDPHSAQEVRQSDRRSDERFWKRYVDFGATAAAVCS